MSSTAYDCYWLFSRTMSKERKVGVSPEAHINRKEIKKAKHQNLNVDNR